jgi:hypothetical protein
MVTLRRIWLWLRIVGRQNWADEHYSPREAWNVAVLIHLGKKRRA